MPDARKEELKALEADLRVVRDPWVRRVLGRRRRTLLTVPPQNTDRTQRAGDASESSLRNASIE
jgi:hypothetical protein